MLPLSHIGFTLTAVKILEKGMRLRHVDYRVVIAASLLPDLIDKSLLKALAGSVEYESRAIGHSLVFLTVIGILTLGRRFWKRETRLLPVFLGVFFHDVFDVMWLHPGIFFWPFYGWEFPKAINEAWLGKVQLGWYSIQQRDLLDNISVWILLYFFMKVALKRKISDFFKKGIL